MLLKQGSAIRLVRFHSRGKIMTNILSTGLRMAGKTLRRGAVSAAMLLALGAGSAYAGDLTILHINDHHSHLKPDGRMSLKLDGKSTRVRSGGMPAVVAKIKSCRG
jgi:2',3'-cyclic-nucleotide 2'-phosphodiesterase (5'-nucleotidase family)